jgi:ATP-dependent DNA ligase
MEFPSPMLARAFRPGKDDKFWTDQNWAAAWKHDGWRMLLAKDADGKVTALSRTHKPIPIPPWLVEWVGTVEPGPLMFDCELLGGTTSTDVAHVILAEPEKLQVVIFDLLWREGKDLTEEPFIARRVRLNGVMAKAGKDLRVTEEYLVRKEEEKRELMESVELAEGEGIIFKHLQSTYLPGSRKALVKLKLTEEWDVVICGLGGKVVAQNAGPDWVGLEYGWTDVLTGKVRKVGSLGVTGPKADLEKLLGKVALVKGYALTEAGCIRHPYYKGTRDDKTPSECKFDFRAGEEA